MSLPPARNLLLGRKAYAILSNISPDQWVSARQISNKTEYNIREVSGCIRSKLLGAYVIRRPGNGGYEYKRLPIN